MACLIEVFCWKGVGFLRCISTNQRTCHLGFRIFFSKPQPNFFPEIFSNSIPGYIVKPLVDVGGNFFQPSWLWLHRFQRFENVVAVRLFHYIYMYRYVNIYIYIYINIFVVGINLHL